MIGEWNVAFKLVLGAPVHVSAFGYDPQGEVWVLVDPHRRFTEVRALNLAAFDAWAVENLPGQEVYRIAARRQTQVWFPGLWCVGHVKRLVGLRSGALSPAGFRRDLVRAGARRVFGT